MTSKNSLFPGDIFIGFENILDEIEKFSRMSGNNYPPYNVGKQKNGDHLIEVAVAGFSKDEISIEVKDRNLTITGRHKPNEIEYAHKGISTKDFKRGFRLSEHVHVVGAVIEDGILGVTLKTIEPEELSPRKIKID